MNKPGPRQTGPQLKAALDGAAEFSLETALPSTPAFADRVLPPRSEAGHSVLGTRRGTEIVEPVVDVFPSQEHPEP